MADDEGTGQLLERLWVSLKARGALPSPHRLAVDEGLSTYCQSPQFDWTDNKDGLNPCQLARALLDICQNSALYDLPRLQLSQGQRRYPDLNPFQASDCACSVPVYNLIQMCAACQQSGPYGQCVPYHQFSGNCTGSPIKVFPYALSVVVPDWALVDTSNGALDINGAYRQTNWNASGNNVQPNSSPSSSAPVSTDATSSSSSAAASSTSPVDAQLGHNQGAKHIMSTGTVVGVVVFAAVALGIMTGVAAWLRRKRRFKRQGQRLGSTADLGGGGGDNDSLRSSMRPPMEEKFRSAHDVSILVPTESIMSGRTRTSRTDSFATNSISSEGTHDYSAYLREGAASRTTFTSSESGSRSSRSYSDDFSLNLDDAASPFADIHRTPSSRSSSSSSAFTSEVGHNNPRMPAASVGAPGRPATRQSVVTFASLAPSAVSLATVSSRAAPSSTGAVYGRNQDDDDDEGGDADSLDSRRL
ncbi:hypothetical protein T439DRAFT_325430 [Meredithblackwellia eburnea MCA 4105]